jgi:hypothetical protein
MMNKNLIDFLLFLISIISSYILIYFVLEHSDFNDNNHKIEICEKFR